MFSNSFKIFNIAGFDVKIDPSWLFIAALIVWSLSTGYFPSTLPGQSNQMYLTLSLVGMLGFFASLVLHELAHSLVARRFDVEIKGITLFIFGGVAELGSEPKTAGSEFWIAIVGPATSFGLAIVFWLFSGLTDLGVATDAIGAVLTYLATINLILAIFNLLPAFPLDGGRVYRAILWNRSGDFLEATRRASGLGSIIAYILIGLGVFGLVVGQQIGALWQVFIGLFLLTAVKSTYQQTLTSAAFKDKTVSGMMTESPFTVSPDQSLSELVNLIMLRHHTSFVPVVEDDILLGYIDATVMGKIDRENWSSTHVGDVYVALDRANPVSPDMPASEVLDRMLQSGQRKLLVAAQRHLLGVITLSDLMEYLRVLQDVGTPLAATAPSKSTR